jgi:hypothetical protein
VTAEQVETAMKRFDELATEFSRLVEEERAKRSK